MIDSYQEFLDSKKPAVQAAGFEIDKEDIHPTLFPFQRDIVHWALRKGRAAIFADCGLGKSFMQLEWARHVMRHTRKPVLIAAPLAVSGQTIKEAAKLGIELKYVRHQSEADGVTMNVTNYEMLEKFNLHNYGGLVVDESAILKNFTGKTRQLLTRKAQDVAFRLACTATPAPNDHLELGNHAEFLGVMKSSIMLRRWFSHNSGDVHRPTLKPHGAADFWTWVSSWAVALRWPSDIGDYDDTGYLLPELEMVGHIVPVDHTRAWDEVDKNGQASFLLTGRMSATSMFREKRATLDRRMAKAAELVNSTDGYVVVWCETNAAADRLRELLPEATEVRGSEPLEVKRQKLESFSNGDYRVLITKPKIAAHGLNWQHVGTQVWTSITHKFEPFYQGYKRSHRFGRKEPVTCHIVYAESEGDILENLRRKHAAHETMQDAMVDAMQKNGMTVETNFNVIPMAGDFAVENGEKWRLYNGDSAIALQNEPDNSLDFIVQSPPFKDIFVYSDSIADLGNSTTSEQFYEQYGYILRDELRRLKPGAYKAEHCQDLPMLKQNTGHEMGLVDFPGELVRAHLNAGFWLAGWKVVWKDPVIEMQRKKVLGLLWSKSFVQSAERARQGVADHVLIFQKPVPGQQPPVTAIDASPMPQSVIDRCMDLWTNKGERLGYHLSVVDLPDQQDYANLARHTYITLLDGRNLVVRLSDPAQMHLLIEAMDAHGMVFHSRVALTDGTWLVVFRKWVREMPTDSHVTHDLKADEHAFIGNDGPTYWDSDRDYSIQVWQRYASPVWYDLDGLPHEHPGIWFDIDQTNVLNHRIAREDKDEKHICLAKGSLVLTYNRGFVPIEDVFPGDLVLTHLGRWRPVLAVRCNGVHSTIKVTSQGVADLRVTPKHELWFRSPVGKKGREKQSAMESKPGWASACETKGGYVNLKLPPEQESYLTESEWWVIGRWLGDGHVDTRGRYHISCSYEERHYLLEKLGSVAGHVADTGVALQVALRDPNRRLRGILRKCGSGASEKQVPVAGLALCQEKAEALLSGYLSADGSYVGKHDRYTASSVSRALLLGMAMVAQRARGVVASVYAGRKAGQSVICGRNVTTKQDWVFAFRNSDGYRKSGFIAGDGAWKKVRTIENVEKKEQVWDIQVEGDESFTAEGCIVHNCPLQLDLIEKCIKQYTRPGDVVGTSFAGVGSELVTAIKLGRRAVGCELKGSYFDLAVQHLRRTERELAMPTLFDWAGLEL